jgi:hypothetical protein
MHVLMYGVYLLNPSSSMYMRIVSCGAKSDTWARRGMNVCITIIDTIILHIHTNDAYYKVFYDM